MGITSDFIRQLLGKGPAGRAKPLPRSTVEHDSVDEMVFGNYADDSPRFRRLAVDEAPKIAPDVQVPDPPDFTTATPEEIKAWQSAARKAQVAKDNAPPYDAWEDLTRDMFYSYHHPREPEVADIDKVDPAVRHHAKIASKMMAEDDHADARNMTRDNPTLAAMATMAAVKVLRGALEDEMVEQARQSEEFERARDKAESAMDQLESMRQQARDLRQNGQPIPGALVQDIRDAVTTKREAVNQVQAAVDAIPKPLTLDAHKAIEAAVAAAKETAENAQGVPGFGQGFGDGEPRYDSPEQALTIADMWANNETLRAVATLYGRMDKHIRFQRAKRVVGGADEIVDLKFGDDLRRVLPTELGALADEDYEDDFYMRFLASEILVYDTVGDENAGKGPIILVGDESGTMSGERNVWLKAMACCLLNICRREKRDFAYVGFSGANSNHQFLFPAKQALGAQDVVDMASHFYGGGTVPIGGIARAVKIMEEREFKKADIVIVGDGQASFGDEDRRLRDAMLAKGVRFHGIGIPSVFGYLKDYAGEHSVAVHDFELENPSEATAHLATHIT